MKQDIIQKITKTNIASVANRIFKATVIVGIVIAIFALTFIGCSKTIVKREFVMSGSARHQTLVDSLSTQIRDCENALSLHEKAKGREF